MVCVVSLALVIHQHRWAREVFVDCLRPSLLGSLLALGARESRGFCTAVAREALLGFAPPSCAFGINSHFAQEGCCSSMSPFLFHHLTNK